VPLALSVTVGSVAGITAGRAPADTAGVTDTAAGVVTSSAWPDATNTGYLGAQASLSSTAAFTAGTAGATYQGLLVSGPITVTAANVTIRNCVINAGYWGIEVTSAASGLLVEDCTIIGGGNCGVMDDGYAGNVIYRRLNISGGSDGMKLSGSYRTIEDCFIHDLYVEAGVSHNDGIQCYSGDHFTFNHNRIDSPDTSCIAMFQGQGAWEAITITSNRLGGGAIYPLYAPGTSGTPPIVVTGNVFAEWGNQPVTDWVVASGWEWSGNTDLSGQPINI
jgi:hypothetical protein